MAGSETWTVKGVSRATREAAREAAASRELTIGAWLDRVLWRAAEETLKPAPPPVTRKEVAQVVGQLLAERLEPIAETRGRLERMLAIVEAPPPRPVAVGAGPIDVALRRVRRRRLSA